MAITAVETFAVPMGDKMVVAHKLTGDGSATTYAMPMGTIDMAIIHAQAVAETTLAATWSGGTLTFSSAIPNSAVVHVIAFGTA
jgi:hypothetical protein